MRRGPTKSSFGASPSQANARRCLKVGGGLPFWSPDGNTLYYWSLGGAGGGPGDEFMAARIQRNPTPVVLSRELLFTGNYFRPASDLHPDGDRVIVAQLAGVSATPDGASAERFLVVTNWFEELRQRMGSN